MSLDETITRLLRSRSDAIDRNIQSLLRGNRIIIYIYKIKKDDGDITAAYVNEFEMRNEERVFLGQYHNIVASRISPYKRRAEGNGSQRVDVTR